MAKRPVDDWAAGLAHHDTERKLHRLLQQRNSAQAAHKRAIADLEAMQQRLELALAISKPGPPAKIRPHSKSKAKREGCAVILASDWHVEEVVDPATVNGKNEYNPEIAERRAHNFARGAAWLIRHHAQSILLPEAVLWFGGDGISNVWHEELLESNAMSPLEALQFLQRLYIQVVEHILEHTDLKRLTLAFSHGNHGRNTKKRRHSTGAKNNLEWMMAHTIKQHFAGEPRVHCRIADGAHLYLDVYDWVVRVTHGDDIKYGGGVGGITIPIRKAIDAWNQTRPAHLTLMGHWHQLLDGRDFVTNSSLIGFNAFALAIKARYEPPAQAFFVIDKKRGKCLFSPIWVEDP